MDCGQGDRDWKIFLGLAEDRDGYKFMGTEWRWEKYMGTECGWQKIM